MSISVKKSSRLLGSQTLCMSKQPSAYNKQFKTMTIITLINHFCVLHILLVSKYRGLPASSILFLWVEGAPAPFSLPFCYLSNTGIKNFSFLCWMLCIVGQKVSSSSCILLRKCWNLLPNNDSIHIEETKIWLQFKTWCSLSVPRCAAYLKGN